MNNANDRAKPPRDNELQRVIEPLASYICATESPRAVLKMALDLLFSEVEQTNQAASARVAAILARQLAVPA